MIAPGRAIAREPIATRICYNRAGDGGVSTQMVSATLRERPVRGMEKVVKVLKSFEESDRADRAYYQALSPHQRLEILWELNRRWPGSRGDEAPERLERVYRIVKFA